MAGNKLDREEYIEQEYFFRIYRERLAANVPTQEILEIIREEILSTTKLPLAIDFLYDEIRHQGKISDGMARLGHYFTPFQTFVIRKTEEDKARFDLPVGLLILEREAEFRQKEAAPAGLFVYQFECISRNRLGYDAGMQAMADDAFYTDEWRNWILMVKRQLGTRDFADFIYLYSQFALEEHRRVKQDPEAQVRQSILFGLQEGRIAKANRNKDPLYMFAALQRQLNYPKVPRPKPRSLEPDIPPAVEARLLKLEKRLQLLEMETSGSLDLSQFYKQHPEFDTRNDSGEGK